MNIFKQLLKQGGKNEKKHRTKYYTSLWRAKIDCEESKRKEQKNHVKQYVSALRQYAIIKESKTKNGQDVLC